MILRCVVERKTQPDLATSRFYFCIASCGQCLRAFVPEMHDGLIKARLSCLLHGNNLP